MSRETKKTILLLGKNGILGSAIAKTATWLDKLTRSQFRSQFIAWDRADLDITDKKQVSQKINRLKPAIVINAAGYTDVDGAEIDRRTAFKVNRDAVGYIAEACRQIGARLIHFSTDYVFDGTQVFGYVEDDVEHLGPVNVYGQTKLEGEKQIKTQNSKFKTQSHNSKLKTFRYFIIRTSWLYGLNGKNFVDMMLEKAKAGQIEFKIVNDQFGWPTYTVDLAERVWRLVGRLDKLEQGIYHCANDEKSKVKSFTPKAFGARKSNLQIKNQKFIKNNTNINGISWYQFAKEIFKQAKKLGLLSTLPNITPCASDEFPRPARRPTYSALLNTKLPAMRTWPLGLKDYLREKV